MEPSFPFQAGRYRLNADYRVEHYIDVSVKDIERHYHEFYEILFFYSGDVEYFIGKNKYHPEANDVLMINIAQVHMPKMHSAFPPYDRISLLIDKGFLARLSGDSVNFDALFSGSSPIIHLSNDESWTAKSLLSQLTNLSSSHVLGSSLYARCYITELLLTLLNAASHAYLNEEINSNQSQRILQVKKYIGNNLASPLSLDTIADALHISKYHLSHEFSTTTGMSLYAYIIKMRLARAAELLKSGKTITDSAMECGFGDISSFGRAFKKEFGITPKQYLNDYFQSGSI